MDDRSNTIAGWILGAGIAALGLTILSGTIFHAEEPHEGKQGYAIDGVEAEGGGGGVVTPLPVLLAAADPAKGEAVFKKCMACHTVASGGANGIGPNLWHTLGEGIGQGKAGFAFSDALKSKGGNWTFDAMDAWLSNPKKFAAGTKMTFAGLGKPEDRANLIVYMNSQGSNLPLPAVEAAAAPAEGAAPADAAAVPAVTPAAAPAK
jgi:cytochrome c